MFFGIVIISSVTAAIEFPVYRRDTLNAFHAPLYVPCKAASFSVDCKALVLTNPSNGNGTFIDRLCPSFLDDLCHNYALASVFTITVLLIIVTAVLNCCLFYLIYKKCRHLRACLEEEAEADACGQGEGVEMTGFKRTEGTPAPSHHGLPRVINPLLGTLV